MNCEELEDLAGALALGAALPEEVAAARAHLGTCPNAHALLRELTVTASLLAEAAEPVEPPPRLRERILAAARAERDTAPEPIPLRPALAGVAAGESRPTAAEASPPAPATTEAPRPAAQPIPIGRGRAERARAWPGWLAAAAVLAVAAGLGAWNIQLRNDVSDRDRQLQAQQQDVADRDLRLATRQRALDAVAQGGQVSLFASAQGGPAEGARGFVVRPSGGNGRPVVWLEGLQQPGEGKVYQLWAMRNGQVRPFDTFQPYDDGTVAVELSDIDNADTLAITVEPGKAVQPSQPPVMTATIRIARIAPSVTLGLPDGM
ncbi:MAG: anti-sigma factor [Chloroflexi bacterium]|nr:anti-sigma factor [Chloroflexota bacterium]